jgi:pimeloyl-ACP methyl ester carboxylesterase/DNA-binding winged helix-turn-helix (wHTH) protein
MIYAFADMELDTEAYELRARGTPRKLEPQVFDVLALLVAHRDRVVTKEELLDRVWGDRFVSESALSSRVKDARRAVDDDGRRQAVIRTVHGRGFRFVAPVEERSATTAPSARPVPTWSTPSPEPRTRYARSGSYSIAYQVVGDGPVDLVFVPGYVSNVELQWEHEAMASFFSRLASFSRLIVFDKRGTGLSDRVPTTEIPTLEERMDDVRAVMDAAGSERATLFGISEGGPLALLFAATFPHRVEGLVLANSYAHRFRDDIPELAEQVREAWGTGGVFGTLAPSWRDRDTRRFLARYERLSATPDAAAHLLMLCDSIDVRAVLPTIGVPTRIVHRRGDEMFAFSHGEELAAAIGGADLVALDGRDHLIYVDQEPVLDAVEEFVTGARPVPVPDRLLTTLVFVEAVGPSQPAADVLDAARGELARHRGVEVSARRDGLLATFDGPARAVRFGRSLQQAAAGLPISLRVGVHTAEVEKLGEDVAGLGVQVGARVAAAATPGEVWVTRTVRDLVAGSGLAFVGRGLHTFAGITEPWELLAVA